MFAAAWLSFDQETQDSFTGLQIFTVLAVAGLGFACLNALMRSRVVATPEALVVVNGYKRRVLAWEQVVGVHLPPGAPWVTLDLADGTTCSAMGIQGSDGGRSAAAARQLRALVNQPRD